MNTLDIYDNTISVNSVQCVGREHRGHLPEDAVIMNSAGHGGIGGADRQIHIRLTRLCINWLWFCIKYKHTK